MEKISKKSTLLYMLSFSLLIIYFLMPLFNVSQDPQKFILPQEITTSAPSLNSQEVVHFFTHQLIRDNNLAFKNTNKYRNYFENDLLTAQEFTNFLNEMYNNNFCLVDINDVIVKTNKDKVIEAASQDNSSITNSSNYSRKFYLNETLDLNGKKPFLLSFDDMSFDMHGNGLSDKLILDENNKIASLTKIDNHYVIEYDKESIPILENFIKEHPDFSHNGARATICVTGYNGILGYRTQKDSFLNRNEEIKGAKKLVDRLKELGYKFACHTYNHENVKQITNQVLEQDLTKFEKEVIDIIGDTDIFCFPYGEATFDKQKIKILKEFGYTRFLCINLINEDPSFEDIVFMPRMVIDRFNLKKCHKDFLPYFDTNKVLI